LLRANCQPSGIAKGEIEHRLNLLAGGCPTV